MAVFMDFLIYYSIKLYKLVVFRISLDGVYFARIWSKSTKTISVIIQGKQTKNALS